MSVKARLSPGEKLHIFIEGRKDRYTVLSEVALEVLGEYGKVYQPKDWLLPGPKQNSHSTPRT